MRGRICKHLGTMYSTYTQNRQLTKYYDLQRFNNNLFEILRIYALNSWTLHNKYMENDPTHQNTLLQLLDNEISRVYKEQNYFDLINREILFHITIQDLHNTTNTSKLNWYSTYLITIKDIYNKQAPTKLDTHH